jgi:hypothetical protein
LLSVALIDDGRGCKWTDDEENYRSRTLRRARERVARRGYRHKTWHKVQRQHGSDGDYVVLTHDRAVSSEMAESLAWAQGPLAQQRYEEFVASVVEEARSYRAGKGPVAPYAGRPRPRKREGTIRFGRLPYRPIMPERGISVYRLDRPYIGVPKQLPIQFGKPRCFKGAALRVPPGSPAADILDDPRRAPNLVVFGNKHGSKRSAWAAVEEAWGVGPTERRFPAFVVVWHRGGPRGRHTTAYITTDHTEAEALLAFPDHELGVRLWGGTYAKFERDRLRRARVRGAPTGTPADGVAMGPDGGGGAPIGGHRREAAVSQA